MVDIDDYYRRDFYASGILMSALVSSDRSTTSLIIHENDGYALSSYSEDFENMIMIGVKELVDEGAPENLLDIRAVIIAEFDQLLSEHKALSEEISSLKNRNEWREGVRDALICVAIVVTLSALVNWFLK
jgi:hypothetical protein